MADPQDKQGDERVEELLSQLKGIFKKLSDNEEGASQSGESPAPPESQPPVEETAPPPMPEPAYEPPPPEPLPEPLVSETPPELKLPPQEEPLRLEPYGSGGGTEPSPAAIPAEPPTNVTVPEPPPELPPGVSYLFTALFYPENRIAEAKTLSQKLESMTPKFMRVSFRLNIRIFATYNARGEWKEAITSQLKQGNIKATFIIVERPLEESKRKALAAELEPQGIYFQEVPLNMLEKKAFYTDMLLGMVFFYDSRKPAEPAA